MLAPFTHDWRPGDRVVSIAVRESVADTGLGTIQRVLLDRTIVLWDDGEQSEERLKDLIIAGFDSSKIVFATEDQFGHRGQKEWWTGSPVISQDITSEIALNERLIINNMMISGIPLSIDRMKGIAWGSFINENFKQGS